MESPRTIRTVRPDKRCGPSLNLSQWSVCLPIWALVCVLVWMMTAGPISVATAETPNSAFAATPSPLVLESIQLQGTERTSLSTVLLYLPLEPGEVVDQAALVAAVDELRRSALFARVAFFTKPGTERGRLILVLEVTEHRFDVRFGIGNTDLDGWYLIPVMLAADNQFGHGERIDLQWRFGFRQNGFLLNFAVPRFGDGRNYWATRLGVLQTDRPYYFDGVEFRHRVDFGGLGFTLGRRLTVAWAGEVAIAYEKVDADSTSTANNDAPGGWINDGEEVGYDDLPPAIQAGVGVQQRTVARIDLRLDSRSKATVAGSPVSGFWGRLKAEHFFQGAESFSAVNVDLRGYRGLAGGIVAGRVRAAAVGDKAAFYDRLYLGGMYTVRGFPTNSLSAPGGDTWLWNASAEYRGPIIGRGPTARLGGVLFIDTGASGGGGFAQFTGVSAGAGFGVRLRFWWLGWLGLDVGFPLTRSPVDEAFHVNATLGWSF